MNRLSTIAFCFLCLVAFAKPGVPNLCYAQSNDENKERILVLREAKEYGKSTVAVELHLIDNILEARITARMYGTKPKIYNAILVGHRLGRLSIESKEVLLATPEEEPPYPTTKSGGFISFSDKTETKKGEGTLTRELLKFKIPRDKIIQGKRYQFWVQIESMQRGGKYKTFKFDLEDFPELFSQ